MRMLKIEEEGSQRVLAGIKIGIKGIDMWVKPL